MLEDSKIHLWNSVFYEILMENIQETLKDKLKNDHPKPDTEWAKFIELFDMAPVGYFILNGRGIIEDVNVTGTVLLNRPKAEITQTDFHDFICPGSLHEFHTCLLLMRQQGTKQNCELKFIISGDEMFFRLEGVAVHPSGPTELKFYIALIDITENRKSELSYYEASGRLKMVLKASSTGILTIDLETQAVYMDDFSYALLGIESWSFNGTTQSILECIHPQDRKKVDRSLRKAIFGDTEIEIEFRTVNITSPEKVVAVKGHNIQGDGKRFFAGLLIDRTKQRKLEQEAENMRLNQQRVVMNATLAAQEKERVTLSQVLHDGICQLLYGIKLHLQNMQFANVYKGPFQNINLLLDQVIKETRDISYELAPSVLRDFGFAAAIKEMTQRLSTETFAINTNIGSQADLLPPQIRLYLFRIIQELINNCIKHANATQVQVKVSVKDDWITLSVGDNGNGFTKPMDQSLKGGSGIRGIKNRVFLLNGEIAFRSSKDGTSITIAFKNDPASMDMDLV